MDHGHLKKTKVLTCIHTKISLWRIGVPGAAFFQTVQACLGDRITLDHHGRTRIQSCSFGVITNLLLIDSDLVISAAVTALEATLSIRTLVLKASIYRYAALKKLFLFRCQSFSICLINASLRLRQLPPSIAML